MRNRLMTVTAALLASATFAMAQTPAQQTTAPAVKAISGSIDFGARITSTTGDEARYERFRDLRDGAAANLVFGKETDTYIFGVTAENIGYRDGRYTLHYQASKVKVHFLFDQIPLNYGYNTSTPYAVSTSGDVVTMTLDSTARSNVQNKVPGVLGIPTTLAQWTTQRSVYAGLARPLDLQARRDTLSFGLTYEITKNLDAEFEFASHKRSGNMPFGMAFAFNNAQELPLPVDDRTNEFEVGIDWANDRQMFRLAYERSMYTDTYNSLVWDNPIRATNWNSTPGTGYDPSGYSNGNGPATGRMATWPDSTLSAVTATGLVKFARRTSLSGNVTFLDFSQNDTLIPWTTNSVIANPTVYASFPGLRQLPRSTAEGKVKGLNASFVFNTRANQYVGLTARYRYNNHDNQTPEFDLVNTVRFDAVPEPPAGATEPYTITQNKFDIDATFSGVPYTSFKIGYGVDANKKTYLVYRKLTDNTLRASADTVGNQYVMLRLLYEHTKRSGSDFHQDAVTDPGGQPNLRLFDDAERTRDRTTVIATLTPTPVFDITASVGFGKDDYDIGLNPQFGLLNNDNTVYNIGLNVNPKEEVSFGLNYGRETYSSLQRSRNANPNSGVPGAYESWSDPNRIWTLDNDETVNSFTLYLDLIKAMPKTDIRFAYDFSDSDNAFVHSGPRIDAFKTNAILTPGDSRPCAAGLTSCFEAMPNVTNQWQRFTFDLKYFFTDKVGFGLGWWYEKFDVSDFAAVDTNGPVGFYAATGTPRIDYLGAITTGYGNRPYKGNTGFARVIYLF
jgi:MtrB/PioB family decaheme-associated outer membrane protein